jgi:hypothetical protein
MFIGAVVMLAGVIAQASSTTMQVFLGARVLSMMHIQKVIHILTSHFSVGFGMSFSINAAPLLISELSYPTHVRQITSYLVHHSNLISARKNDIFVQFAVVFW